MDVKTSVWTRDVNREPEIDYI